MALFRKVYTVVCQAHTPCPGVSKTNPQSLRQRSILHGQLRRGINQALLLHPRAESHRRRRDEQDFIMFHRQPGKEAQHSLRCL